MYTPLSPQKAQLRGVPDVVAAILTKPFSELNRQEKDTRWTNAIDYIYTLADQEYINKTWLENETNELFRLLVEVEVTSDFPFFSCLNMALCLQQFSTRQVNVARNRVQLVEEVHDEEEGEDPLR